MDTVLQLQAFSGHWKDRGSWSVRAGLLSPSMDENQSGSLPPAVPRVEPDRWEDFPVLREIFLCDIYGPGDVEVFRRIARLVAVMVAERGQAWPSTYLNATARYLQAALADLRYLQGFLRFACYRDEDRRDGDRHQYGGDEEAVRKHDRLCELGNLVAAEIGVLADEIEKEVGEWQLD
jgi:hypothetical protein